MEMAAMEKGTSPLKDIWLPRSPPNIMELRRGREWEFQWQTHKSLATVCEHGREFGANAIRFGKGKIVSG